MTEHEQRLQMQLTAAQGALADVLRELREAHTIACGTDPANQTRSLIDLVQELRLAGDLVLARQSAGVDPEALRTLLDNWRREVDGYVTGGMLDAPVGEMNRASAHAIRRCINDLQRLIPRCDHKFVDSRFCLKCGWQPSADELAALLPPASQDAAT